MKIWLDAQLSPSLAPWLEKEFGIAAKALRDLGLRDATVREVFLAARATGATVMSKDQDFVRLLEELGAPPQIVWLTFGNTSNARLKNILNETADRVLTLLREGEPLVEIRGA